MHKLIFSIINAIKKFLIGVGAGALPFIYIENDPALVRVVSVFFVVIVVVEVFSKNGRENDRDKQ